MTDIKRSRLSLKAKRERNSTSENDEENVSTKKPRYEADTSMSDEENLFDEIVEVKVERSNEEIICLSDDEIGSDLTKHKPKGSDIGDTSLLDIEDDELKILRIKLLQLRRLQPPVEYQDLPMSQTNASSLAINTSKPDEREETLPRLDLMDTSEKYSPLPKYCISCARRKPLHHDFSTIIYAILNTTENKLTLDHVDNGQMKLSNKIPVSKEKSDCESFEDDFMNASSSVVKEGNGTWRRNIDDDAKHKKTKIDADIHLEPQAGCSTKFDSMKSSSSKDSVTTCPLCTVEFKKGSTQLDIDGHIAACLSAAGDDVTW